MVKQSSIQKCACGRDISFPEGEVRTVCRRCGSEWQMDCGGFWFTQAVFTPFVVRDKKQTRRERKAGKRC